MEHPNQWMALFHGLIQGPGFFPPVSLPSSTWDFQAIELLGERAWMTHGRFAGTRLEAAQTTLGQVPLARAHSHLTAGCVGNRVYLYPGGRPSQFLLQWLGGEQMCSWVWSGKWDKTVSSLESEFKESEIRGIGKNQTTILGTVFGAPTLYQAMHLVLPIQSVTRGYLICGEEVGDIPYLFVLHNNPNFPPSIEHCCVQNACTWTIFNSHKNWVRKYIPIISMYRWRKMKLWEV